MVDKKHLILVIAQGREIGVIMPRWNDLIVDGLFHGIGTEKKPKGKDGRYCIRPDGSWQVTNWQTGETRKSSSVPQKGLSAKKKKELLSAEAEMQKQLEHQKHAEGAKKAQKYWDCATDVEEVSKTHSYLREKNVLAYGLKVSKRGELLIPGRDSNGNLLTLQKIYKAGDKFEKRFFKDTTYKGAYFVIPANDQDATTPIYIAEGYATGASIHEATGGEVWIAFNADNLKAVAIIARENNE